MEVCDGSPVSLQGLSVGGGPCSAVVRGLRHVAPGRIYYEATITGGPSSSKTAPARGIRLGWATGGGWVHGKVGESDSSIGFDGAAGRVYCDARQRAATEKKRADEEAEAARRVAEKEKEEAEAKKAAEGGAQAGAQAQAEPGTATGAAPATPTTSSPAGTNGSLLPPPLTAGEGTSSAPPVAPAEAKASTGEEGWDSEGLSGLFVEEDEEEEYYQYFKDEPDGGRPVSVGGKEAKEGKGEGEEEKEGSSEAWRVGDVVGCLADLTAKTLVFHVNGVLKVRLYTGPGRFCGGGTCRFSGGLVSAGFCPATFLLQAQLLC